MEQSTATRRLVKSPPELWAELSTEDSLGRHLAEFGEIRITRIDPETTVAWEGDRVSGTVELAPTGWGTKVVLTATPAAEPAKREAAPQTEPAVAQVAPPEPEAAVPQPGAAAAEPQAVASKPEVAEPAAEPAKKRGFFARLFGRRDKTPQAAIPGPPAAVPGTKAAIPGPPAPAPDPTPPAPTPSPGPLPPAPDPSPPTPTPQPGPPPQIRAVPDAERRTAILTDVLATLGSDHHRPYSRERD
jgi:hypothetical protein